MAEIIMKWQRRMEYITDEDGNVVCILPNGVDERYVQMILKTPRMFEALTEYVENMDAGSLPAKKLYNKFKVLVDEVREVA